MNTSTSLRTFSIARGVMLAALAAAPAFFVAQGAFAQTTPAPARPSTFAATINADATVVRCAPNAESGYAFGSLSAGQTVTVVETQTGWVRVRTEGNAFSGWGGYVPALPGVTLSADGKTITISKTAPINAPNDSADFNPDRSSKAIGYLTDGDTLPVLEVLKGEHDTYYAVPLSAKTSGWIAESAITRLNVETPKPEGVTTEIVKPVVVQTDEAKPESTEPAADDDSNIKKITKAIITPTKPAVPAVPTAAQMARAKFTELENTWQKLTKENCSVADLQELHTGFVAITQDTTAMAATRRNALTRSTQIASILELRALKARMQDVEVKQVDKTQELADLKAWVDARPRYDAVGVLNASLVYDGVRLPRLYRLQDPTSGFTTAYLQEDPAHELSSMLGLMVGVKGPVHFDESLRRNLITAQRVAVIQAGKEVEIASPVKAETRNSGSNDGSDNSGK